MKVEFQNAICAYVCEEFGFDESLVIPTKMSELENLRAERPKENSLDISLAKTLKTVLLDIPDGD